MEFTEINLNVRWQFDDEFTIRRNLIIWDDFEVNEGQSISDFAILGYLRVNHVTRGRCSKSQFIQFTD